MQASTREHFVARILELADGDGILVPQKGGKRDPCVGVEIIGDLKRIKFQARYMGTEAIMFQRLRGDTLVGILSSVSPSIQPIWWCFPHLYEGVDTEEHHEEEQERTPDTGLQMVLDSRTPWRFVLWFGEKGIPAVTDLRTDRDWEEDPSALQG